MRPTLIVAVNLVVFSPTPQYDTIHIGQCGALFVSIAQSKRRRRVNQADSDNPDLRMFYKAKAMQFCKEYDPYLPHDYSKEIHGKLASLMRPWIFPLGLTGLTVTGDDVEIEWDNGTEQTLNSQSLHGATRKGEYREDALTGGITWLNSKLTYFMTTSDPTTTDLATAVGLGVFCHYSPAISSSSSSSPPPGPSSTPILPQNPTDPPTTSGSMKCSQAGLVLLVSLILGVVPAN